MAKQSVPTSAIPMNPLVFIRKYDELWSRVLFLLGGRVVYSLCSQIQITGINKVIRAELL